MSGRAQPAQRVHLHVYGEEQNMAEAEKGSQRIRRLLNKYKYVILISWIVLSVVVLGTGVIVMNVSRTKIVKSETVMNYTECESFSFEQNALTCLDYIKQNPDATDCVCLYKIKLNLTGEVTVYYELTSFDQSSTDYINSKDNDQLSGILKNPPSDNCKPYQYNNDIAIYPCGAVADTLFQDSIDSFKYLDNNKTIILDLLQYSMLSVEDKAGFKNPIKIEEALQNFSKPIHWKKHIYELDLVNEDNNGIQNEQFISWMRTDWKRKPLARVDHNVTGFNDGLPAGDYQIVIKYLNSPFGYYGDRNFIFVGQLETIDYGPHTDGVVLLNLGILMLCLGVLYPALAKIYSDKKQREKMANREDVASKDNVNDENPQPLLSQENNLSPTQN